MTDETEYHIAYLFHSVLSSLAVDPRASCTGAFSRPLPFCYLSKLIDKQLRNQVFIEFARY